jgi:hypothetical protein
MALKPPDGPGEREGAGGRHVRRRLGFRRANRYAPSCGLWRMVRPSAGGWCGACSPPQRSTHSGNDCRPSSTPAPSIRPFGPVRAPGRSDGTIGGPTTGRGCSGRSASATAGTRARLVPFCRTSPPAPPAWPGTRTSPVSANRGSRPPEGSTESFRPLPSKRPRARCTRGLSADQRGGQGRGRTGDLPLFRSDITPADDARAEVRRWSASAHVSRWKGTLSSTLSSGCLRVRHRLGSSDDPARHRTDALCA